MGKNVRRIVPCQFQELATIAVEFRNSFQPIHGSQRVILNAENLPDHTKSRTRVVNEPRRAALTNQVQGIGRASSETARNSSPPIRSEIGEPLFQGAKYED